MSTITPTLSFTPTVRIVRDDRRPVVSSAVRRVPAQRVSMTSSASVRLTRRGRLVVLMVGLVVALVLAVTYGARSVATGDDGVDSMEIVQVAPGQTLWQIADHAAGDGSTVSMIATIKRINDLESSSLSAGQRIIVPRAK